MITTVRRSQLVAKAQTEVDRVQALISRNEARKIALLMQLAMATVELEYRQAAPVSDEAAP